ncbi:oxidoreductase [Clostridium estertheticum]|uniref:2-enoate reductase n=1 Tax=Clostridium estertheticum subsp. estertheticum TaxID=1552 RepID=A0A1J0GCL4_9CLOT|nr:FAD-dependent oxidoreductase [Clostridium estertheticum]APC39098.1 2-enoate reductase [Clostridium estertheticum subsp. estertheticum]MBU3075001.1 FAD-dependent oxidoreductase [Clostridium estertheticum]MBU3165216.1 FAD-dependent oxidoreductase [Clostridium estertheticum]MBU3173549.1 FAD-dependent oxidoreductase [Clostridium estertheticum]MBZ9614934.1 FAD-dependent oxidoreductase [Clostridium estertheticum subsp. laramiense]
MNKYKKLFEPIKIGKCEIKNRFALAPMGPLGLADSEGGFNQRGIDYYTERAKGGTGLIITGVTFVDNEVEEHGMPNCPCSTYNPVQFVRTGKELTERIHAYNAKVFLQMSGGFGRVTIPTNLGDFPPVAPSPIQHRWLDKTCREITIDEIKSIVKKFGDGAYNAKRAGFDGIEIHAVHEGYLIDQFAMSLFNHRTDEYGGSLDNRLRFAREIVEEIKDRCGEDYPVVLRYSPKSFIKDLRDGALPGEEFTEKGRDLEEGIKAAKLLVSYGYDSLDTDVGSYDSWWWSHPPMYQDKGLYRPYAKLMKETVDVPIMCAGRMDNPDMALDAIENGTCDIISLGRPLLADPDYVNKLRSNNLKSIRPCISCQEGCMGRIQHYSMLNCAVNPQACKEKDNALTPILKKKKVLIVGGGVAGCEAARVLTLRGHEAIIFEKNDRLGGNLIPGGVPDFKEDDIALANWFEHTLKELKVQVNLNAEVTKDQILKSDFDSVIIATGSTPKVFPLGDDAKVFTAADVLLGKKDCKDTTVIVGGGLVGCELALHLAKEGKNVTIVEALNKILALNGPLCSANSEMLEKLIPFNKIAVKTNSKVKAYKDGLLEMETENGIEKIKCDSVILSVGYKEENSLYKELEFEVPEIYLLGDARKVSNIMYGIWDAYEVANHI